MAALGMAVQEVVVVVVVAAAAVAVGKVAWVVGWALATAVLPSERLLPLHGWLPTLAHSLNSFALADALLFGWWTAGSFLPLVDRPCSSCL